MRKASVLVLIVAALGVGGWRWRVVSQARANDTVQVPTAEVTRGNLVVTLPINGLLQSASETPVRCELAGALIEIRPDNSAVKPGDFAYRLDTKDLDDQREQLRQALTDAQESADSEKADATTHIAQAESDLKNAQEDLQFTKAKAEADRVKMEAQVQFAEGELKRVEQELTRSQRLAKLNYIPGTQLADAEKAYRKQQFALEQQRAQQADVAKTSAETIADKQTALELAQHSLVTTKADSLSHAEEGSVQVAEATRKLAEVDKKIAQCTLLAPAAGLAVIETNDNSWPERRPYRLGDQVESGAAPVMIYDVTRMQVRCQIGEMDITSVKQGQQAYVSTPAEPDRRYPGKVALVEELAKESNVWQGGTPGKKVFEVLVTLERTDPTRLRPGMSVDLEIELGKVREAMMAPIRAVFTEQGKSFLYVERGTDFARVPVTVGARNDLQVEVKGEVRVGERIALERPPEKPNPRARGKGKP